MITLIHTADWQLGKPFAGIQDQQKRARVQQERVDAVRRIGEVVRQRNAHFVVVAGDLFDSPTPTRPTVSAACEAIGSLGVPVYAIPGNHDHGGHDSFWEQEYFLRERAQLAPNFHMLLAREPVEIDEAVLLPCPLLRRHEADDSTAWLRSYDFSSDSTKPRIVIAHGSTQHFSGEADEEDQGQPNFIDLCRLPMDEIDYVALGDWHGFVDVGQKAWFSGSHEIDRFPKSNQLPGHVVCAMVGRGQPPRVEPVPTGQLQWLTHDITLDENGPSRLNEILAQVTHAVGSHRSLIKLGLRGSLSLAARKSLDDFLDSWEARLLRLKVDDGVQLTPSEAEIDALTNRPSDPIISGVARELVSRLGTSGDEGRILRKSLNLLHSYCR